jgi:hypothetical protein
MLLLVSVGTIGTGCGGVAANGSVSPATFLLPGIGQTDPQPSPAAADGFQTGKSPEIAAYAGGPVR